MSSTPAQRPELPGAQPNPLRFLAFVAGHPHCAGGARAAATLKPTKSFATTRFNGLHAYHLIDADGRRRAFRARFAFGGRHCAVEFALTDNLRSSRGRRPGPTTESA